MLMNYSVRQSFQRFNPPKKTYRYIRALGTADRDSA